ncbi:MAG: hypothetical protein MJ158_01700 [Alphaproteobacteria bacterium]|nr:hypothetical protein [Alphaproteobacteria bacterium]
MKKFVLSLCVTLLYTGAVNADYYAPDNYNDVYNNNYYNDMGMYDGSQVIYNDIPVKSYYAYPDDQNFIPETEFMEQNEDIDFDENLFEVRSYEYDDHPGVQFTERPTVVCRDFGCTKLNDRITKTFLFNSLANMFMTNAHSRLYLCEADPFSRSCLQSGISFPVRAGVANALVKIPKASISQVDISTGLSRATIGITYDFIINGVDRICEPTVIDISVPTNAQATLSTREFSCNMTSDGMSNVSILFNIDYIDLDYGLIGGYYSLGMQGTTIGGGTGYALFKTEYSNRGMKYKTNTGKAIDSANVTSTIRPGEYAVEALEK